MPAVLLLLAGLWFFASQTRKRPQPWEVVPHRGVDIRIESVTLDNGDVSWTYAFETETGSRGGIADGREVAIAFAKEDVDRWLAGG